jgi:dienelactone hydrolase
MRYFVEPCIRIINELETPGRKFMVFGFSGGGTTAGLVGGIDTRVTATVPAGGTSAQYMLNNSAPANLRGRDYEEVLWRLRLDHPDFYLMATTGGRPVLQLFNTLDTSAVTVDNFGQYLSYEAQVNSAAQSWGGSFGVEFIARSGHHIDDVMLARVLDFFNAA